MSAPQQEVFKAWISSLGKLTGGNVHKQKLSLSLQNILRCVGGGHVIINFQ